MEIKKSKKANLENKKRTLFLFGLLTSLGITLMAFEWASFGCQYDIPEKDLGELFETEPAVKEIKIIKPKPKSSTPKKTDPLIVDKFKIDNKKKEDSVIVFISPKNLDPGPIELLDSFDFEEFEDPIIPPVFILVEEMPSYKGGVKELYKYLSKNLKYTAFAREIGIQGTVNVQFIIEKDGSITNVKILRGIEPSLDKVAFNTIKGMKNWNPGKQRKKEVRVKMSLPIKFKLKH